MIFATYQPLEPKKKDFTFKDSFYGQLGFNPVWCFAADDLYNFWINSILAVPVCPEKLIVFETDEYWAIDKTDWYRALHNKNECLPEVISKDLITDVNNVEFLVRKIENILYEVDIKESIYSRISQKEIDDILEPLMQRNRKRLDEIYKEINCGTSYDIYMQNNIAADYRKIYIFCNQYGIEDYRKNLNRGYDIDINTNYISKNDKLYDLLDEYSSPDTSFKLYCEIRKELEKAVVEKKIYPNDICPCGSGKKYKKCCMKK